MKTLFVDFDGTICHDRFWRSLPSTENVKVQEFLFLNNNLVVIDWMKGVYTSEEINMLISTNTGLDYDYLWDIFVQDCQNMAVQTELLELINQLRIKFHVVLITGNMDCFSRFTVPALSLHEYFDVIVNSYSEKQLKTDNNGSTFTKYVKGDIKDSILIEDSEKSCSVFTELGGTANRVINKEDTLDHLVKLL